MTTCRKQSAWHAALALVVAFSVVTPAYALDAYWHGVRSDRWHHGPSSGVSNWYSQAPTNGQPRDVPDGEAIFADDAAGLTVTIVKPATIGKITFEAVEDFYVIRVHRRLEVLVNPGVRNSQEVIPFFDLYAQMILRGRTNTGKAEYRINADGILELSLTRGTANDRVLNAHKVINSGRLIIGKNRFDLTRPYVQKPGSFLTVQLGNDAHGLLTAPDVKLAGDLVVKGTQGLEPGVYRIVQSNGFSGQFANVHFQGFANNVTPSLRYSPANGNISVRVVAND